MELDITQWFADPMQRRLVLAGAATVLGFVSDSVSRIYHSVLKREMELEHHPLVSSYQDKSHRFERGRKISSGTAGLTLVSCGLEGSIINSNPLLGSYSTEAVTDIGLAVGGYILGRNVLNARNLFFGPSRVGRK